MNYIKGKTMYAEEVLNTWTPFTREYNSHNYMPLKIENSINHSLRMLS